MRIFPIKYINLGGEPRPGRYAESADAGTLLISPLMVWIAAGGAEEVEDERQAGPLGKVLLWSAAA
jgi:hypothetical protein